MNLLKKGLALLTRDQWAVWKFARESQGVTKGDVPEAGRTHPDIDSDFSQLPENVKNFLSLLTELGRIETFRRALALPLRRKMIEAGQRDEPIEGKEKEEIARAIHNGWWACRLMTGQCDTAPHEGDRLWSDESDVQRENDLVLVHQWCLLLGAYAAAAPEEGMSEELREIVSAKKAVIDCFLG